MGEASLPLPQNGVLYTITRRNHRQEPSEQTPPWRDRLPFLHGVLATNTEQAIKTLW